MSDILISGYYGFKNSGDDALLLAIINGLKEKKPDIKLSVLSKSPKETSEIYGVKAVNRLNPFAVVYNMITTKMLISGGGTLIQDRTSTKSLLYYLFIIKCAHLFGKKIMLYANGIGPLIDEKNRRLTAKVLNKADIITLRDEDSEKELKALGIDKPKIEVTADPAFALECKNPERGEKLLKERGIKEGDRLACISVRPRSGIGEEFAETVARTADYLTEEYGYKIVILPMQQAKDLDISEKIAKLMKSESICINENLSVDDMLSIISRMDLCIGMRLHSLIYSASFALPIIGLVYDPKIAGFMDYIGQRLYTGVSSVTFEKMKKLVDEEEQNRDMIINELSRKLTDLKKKSKYNADCAIGLLEGGKIL